MLWLKQCPRCQQGDLHRSRDMWGDFVACLQCGYYLPDNEGLNMQQMTGQWTRHQLDTDLGLFQQLIHATGPISGTVQDALTASGYKNNVQRRLMRALIIAEKLRELGREVPAHGRVILWANGRLEIRDNATGLSRKSS